MFEPNELSRQSQKHLIQQIQAQKKGNNTLTELCPGTEYHDV